LADLLEKAAKRKKIKTQLQPEPPYGGTDASAIQLTRAGVAAGLISIATRYLHSPVETIALADAENAVKLLAELLAGLTGRENLAPIAGPRRPEG
jgi:endoglucanase